MFKWRESLPGLMAKLTILLSLIVMISYGLALLRADETSGKYGSNDAYRLENPESWEISIGDLPIENERPDMSGVVWKPLTEVIKGQKLKRYKGYYWLRTKLPDQSLRDPHLMIVGIQSYEVFFGEERLLSFHMPPSPPIVNENGIRKLIPLDADRLTEPLYLRIYSHAKPPYSLLGLTRYGDEGDLLSSMLSTHVTTFSFGVIFILAGVISLFLYFLRERNLLYLSFFLFALTAGVGTLNKSSIGHWFITPERFVYFPEVFPNLGIFAFMLFLEQIAIYPYKLGFRVIGFGAILYTALTFLFIKINMGFYYSWVIVAVRLILPLV
jgi:hypothetical protein